MNVTQVLAGRREGDLLAYPSVRHMTDLLAMRCREPSWIRSAVATLQRFRLLTGQQDLEALLDQARADPRLAEEALTTFAGALSSHADSQISALAFGPKLWFCLNGVQIPWQPLAEREPPPMPIEDEQQRISQLLLLALIGSGLHLSEVLRLQLGDVGSLDANGELLPDLRSDPLAVRYTPHQGKRQERITFLTYQTRAALLAAWQQIKTPPSADLPLIARNDGSTPDKASIARARKRNRALIHAGNEVNVTLCRTTGDFFRAWGLPGSRFVGPEELHLEDFV